MKKITLCLMLIFALIIVPGIVSAEDSTTVVASVIGEDFTDLKTAIEYAQTSGKGEVYVRTNATLTDTVDVTEDLIIRLNGYTVSGANKLFDIKGANFELVGPGTLEETSPYYAPIYISGDSTKETTFITKNGGITLKGWAGIMISADAANAKGIDIKFRDKIIAVNDIEGGEGAGIYINGQVTESANVKIELEYANITSTGDGVYAAGYADWTIKDSEITGVSAGLGIKSGKFDIDNSTITATGEDKTPTAGYGNGINPSGAAIQIESNSGYPGNIELDINASTIKSQKGVAFYEYLADSTTDTAITKTEITDTLLVSAEGKSTFATSEKFDNEVKKFITSGTYSADVSEYVVDGYVCKKIEDYYVVGKEHNIILPEDIEGGKIIVREVPTSNTVKEIDKAILGETVEVVVEPAEGYRFKEISGVDGLKDVAEYAYQFIMPNKDIVLTPVFEKITTEAEVPSEVANEKEVEEMLIETLKENKELAEIIKDKNVEIKVEVKEKEVTSSEKEKIESAASKEVADIKVTNYIDISIYVKDADNGKNLGNLETVKEAITFTVPVPEDLPELAEGFRRIFYIVREHDGDIDVWEVKESDGKLSFESDKFSTYAIAYKDVENSGEGTAESKPEDNKTENKPTTPDVPQTGDNVVIFAILAIVAIAGIVIIKRLNVSKRKH